MGSLRRKLHNDRVKMTDVEMKITSPSKNQEKMRRWPWAKQQLRNRAPHCKQQHEAYESSSSRTAVKNFAMGWRLRVKNCATGSLQRWRYWLRIPRTKEGKFWWEAGATDEVWYSADFLSECWCISWFPWLVCPPPDFLGFVVDVAPNPRILCTRICKFSTVTACVLSHVFSVF